MQLFHRLGQTGSLRAITDQTINWPRSDEGLFSSLGWLFVIVLYFPLDVSHVFSRSVLNNSSWYKLGAQKMLNVIRFLLCPIRWIEKCENWASGEASGPSSVLSVMFRNKHLLFTSGILQSVCAVKRWTRLGRCIRTNKRNFELRKCSCMKLGVLVCLLPYGLNSI